VPLSPGTTADGDVSSEYSSPRLVSVSPPSHWVLCRGRLSLRWVQCHCDRCQPPWVWCQGGVYVVVSAARSGPVVGDFVPHTRDQRHCVSNAEQVHPNRWSDRDEKYSAQKHSKIPIQIYGGYRTSAHVLICWVAERGVGRNTRVNQFNSVRCLSFLVTTLRGFYIGMTCAAPPTHPSTGGCCSTIHNRER